MTTSNRTLATGARRRARSLGILSGALGLLLLTAPSDGRAEDGDAVRYDRSSGKVKTKNTLNTKFQAAAKQAIEGARIDADSRLEELRDRVEALEEVRQL